MTLNRRAFVVAAGAGAGHLLGRRTPLSAGPPHPRNPVVAREPWGRLEEIGSSVWALVSTPRQDRTTLCNGGIVAGDRETLIVEGFGSVAGSEWMTREARRLTGRRPTHVVLSHFHGDHTSGLTGFGPSDDHPAFHATATTVGLIRESDARRGPVDPIRTSILNGVNVVSGSASAVIELGGRSVTVTPRVGHTPSDVTVAVEGAAVVFCGDLVWNNMFPNYRDTIPSRLSEAVRALRDSRTTTYVPGHGSLATPDDLNRFIEVIDWIEVAARDAVQRGTPAAEAARTFLLPNSLGEWYMFSPRYYEVAFGAWERELRG